MQREIGYYWCRDDDEWEIAHWDGENWQIITGFKFSSDGVWDEIDPTPITRK